MPSSISSFEMISGGRKRNTLCPAVMMNSPLFRAAVAIAPADTVSSSSRPRMSPRPRWARIHGYFPASPSSFSARYRPFSAGFGRPGLAAAVSDQRERFVQFRAGARTGSRAVAGDRRRRRRAGARTGSRAVAGSIGCSFGEQLGELLFERSFFGVFQSVA